MDSIVKYTDFLKGYFEYNAWKSEDSFPVQLLSESGVDELSEYEIVEQVFKGVEEERDEFSFKYGLQNFRSGLQKEFVHRERSNVYLYAIEHKKKNQSKIRSYKGLIDKKEIAEDRYIQSEITLKNQQTIISFVAVIDDSNFNYLVDFFLDDATCFVIKTDKNYLNLDFLDEMMPNIRLNMNTQINYLKLLNKFVSINDIIYRIGGDSGESYWSLQKFQRARI